MAASGSCSVAMTGRRRSGMGIRRGMEPFAVASIGRGESKSLQFALLVDPSLPNTLHFLKSIRFAFLCFCSTGEFYGDLRLDRRAPPLTRPREQDRYDQGDVSAFLSLPRATAHLKLSYPDRT